MKKYRIRSHHCRYCNEDGHDVRTCQKLREDAPNNVYAQHVLTNVSERQEKASDRTCSYCRKPGHNLQTCSDKIWDEGQKKILRRDVFKLMKENGFNEATLFSLTMKDGEIHHYLVEQVWFDYIGDEYCSIVKAVNILDSKHELNIKSKDLQIWLKNELAHGMSMQVIERAPDSSFEINFQP